MAVEQNKTQTTQAAQTQIAREAVMQAQSAIMEKNSERVRAVMEGWARWLCTSAGTNLGWGPTVLGRMIAGLPSTKCTRCDGAGTLMTKNTHGHKKAIPCPRCDGAGKITGESTAHKINPAFIHATAPRYENPLYQRVDAILRELNYLQQLVAGEEYLGNGTQVMKARRIGTTQERYARLLAQVHVAVERGLAGGYP